MGMCLGSGSGVWRIIEKKAAAVHLSMYQIQHKYLLIATYIDEYVHCAST